MKHEESNLQKSAIKWFDAQYGKKYCITFTEKRAGKSVSVKTSLLYAIPNGGNRGKIEAAIMKGEGVRPGVADLFLSVAKNQYHGCYIEFKTQKGKQSESQKHFQALAEAHNYKYIVVRDLNQFINEITAYLQ